MCIGEAPPQVNGINTRQTKSFFFRKKLQNAFFISV